MNVHVPTTFEIHMIAYLTLHGWSYAGDTWTKAGFQTTRTSSYSCGCCTHEDPTEEFDLGDAYYAQKEAAES